MRVYGIAVLALLLVCSQVTADPVTGTYHSTDIGGQLYTGRASTWRTGINSGLPHVLHIQSWDGTTLGTQWEVLCPIEDTPFDVQDKTLITTVQYVNGIPVASVVNGNTSGTFDNGALLVFAIGNGVGVGETTSLDPSITIPPDYPVFMDDTCNPAPDDKQFGTWGDVCSITMQIDATISTESETWGSIKSLFK